MKTINKFLAAFAFVGAVSLTGNALADDMVNGYVQSAGGVVTNPWGECWRTPFVDTTEKLEACGYEKVAMEVEVVKTPTAASVTAKVVERIVLGATMLFAFDSAKLTDDAKAIIDERIARAGGKVRLTSIMRIEGHTDSTGPEAYNQKLSERRAQAVADYIVANARNVTVSDIEVVGKGETEPVASNATREGRAQNRRVVIVAEGEEIK